MRHYYRAERVQLHLLENGLSKCTLLYSSSELTRTMRLTFDKRRRSKMISGIATLSVGTRMMRSSFSSRWWRINSNQTRTVICKIYISLQVMQTTRLAASAPYNLLGRLKINHYQPHARHDIDLARHRFPLKWRRTEIMRDHREIYLKLLNGSRQCD